MKLFNTYLFVATLLLSYSAHAHEPVKSYNQISLDATASAEVENDTMVVSLYAQEEGSKATTLSNKVNGKINWALKYLAQHKEIKVETENYSTVPVYNNNQVIAWRVKQTLKLESTNMPLMSEVLGELQEQLNLSGISFDVSREKREQETQLLIDQAITAYNKRATQIANKLQRDNYKIVNMHVTTSTSPIQHRYRKSTALMAEASSVVPPAMAAGDRTLSVRVNGTIELE
jgi:predicted secreted protein